VKHLTISLFLPLATQASVVSYSFETYYLTLPDRLFKHHGHELDPFSNVGSNHIIYGWTGRDTNQRHTVELHTKNINIDGKILPRQRVKPFPGETIDPGDLGGGAKVFFADGWRCIEGTPPSASGSAVRHKSVYLIHSDKQGQAWKLPTLFSSCQGIRMHGHIPIFDHIQYRYINGEDEPIGITFMEYAIENGAFFSTGKVHSATFIEAGNVYKFSF
jgi:hypothetical protein